MGDCWVWAFLCFSPGGVLFCVGGCVFWVYIRVGIVCRIGV